MAQLTAPIVSVPGMGGYNATQSINLLQNAIKDIGDRRRKRTDEGISALDEMKTLQETGATRDVLKNTQTGRTSAGQILGNYVNQQANYLFNPDGSPKEPPMNMTPAEQAEFKAKQQRWNQGGFGDSFDDKELQWLERNQGTYVEDATAYANAVYDNLIKRGVSPEKAEEVRKRELARNKPQEMSKAKLEQLKSYDALQKEMMKQELDALENAYQDNYSYKQGGATSNGKMKSHSGSNKVYNNQDKFLEALKIDKGDDWFVFGSGSGGQPVYEFYREMLANGIKPKDAYNYIATNLHEEIVGTDNEIDSSKLKIPEAAKTISEWQSVPGFKGTGTGGTGYIQRSGIPPERQKAYFEDTQKIMNKYKTQRANAWAKATPASRRQVVSNMANNWYEDIPSENKQKAGKKKVLKHAGESSRITFGDNTGGIGAAMNKSKSDGSLANYAKTNPVQFVKDYNNLTPEQKKAVSKVLGQESLNKILSSDTGAKETIKDGAKKEILSKVPDSTEKFTGPKEGYKPIFNAPGDFLGYEKIDNKSTYTPISATDNPAYSGTGSNSPEVPQTFKELFGRLFGSSSKNISNKKPPLQGPQTKQEYDLNNLQTKNKRILNRPYINVGKIPESKYQSFDTISENDKTKADIIGSRNPNLKPSAIRTFEPNPNDVAGKEINSLLDRNPPYEVARIMKEKYPDLFGKYSLLELTKYFSEIRNKNRQSASRNRILK